MFIVYFFLTLFFLIFQAGIFSPVFDNIFLVPSFSFIIVLSLKDKLKEKTLILAFLNGLFSDAVAGSWGIFTISETLFTYVYLLITSALFIRKKSHEILWLFPPMVLLRKAFILLLANYKFAIDFSFKNFLISYFIDLIFILIIFKLIARRINEEA